jgi:hypothetical protein
MPKVAALISVIFLSVAVGVVPSSAATPAPREIRVTFPFVDATGQTPMIVRLWSPNGKTSISFRCVSPVHTFNNTSIQDTDLWTKKCKGNPYTQLVRVTLNTNFDVRDVNSMVVRIWSPNQRTSTAWRCNPPVTYGYSDSSSVTSDWYEGHCAAA